jgi:hypothetical protein
MLDRRRFLQVDLASIRVEHAPPAPEIYAGQGDQSTGGSHRPPRRRSRQGVMDPGTGCPTRQVSAGNQVRVHRVVCALDCGQMVNPDIIRAQLPVSRGLPMAAPS